MPKLIDQTTKEIIPESLKSIDNSLNSKSYPLRTDGQLF